MKEPTPTNAYEYVNSPWGGVHATFAGAPVSEAARHGLEEASYNTYQKEWEKWTLEPMDTPDVRVRASDNTLMGAFMEYERVKAEELNKTPAPPLVNKYSRPCPYDTVDVYRICEMFEVTDPCLQHALKKVLCAGQRGHKSGYQDVEEAIMALARWQEMRIEEKYHE